MLQNLVVPTTQNTQMKNKVSLSKKREIPSSRIKETLSTTTKGFCNSFSYMAIGMVCTNFGKAMQMTKRKDPLLVRIKGLL